MALRLTRDKGGHPQLWSGEDKLPLIAFREEYSKANGHTYTITIPANVVQICNDSPKYRSAMEAYAQGVIDSDPELTKQANKRLQETLDPELLKELEEAINHPPMDQGELGASAAFATAQSFINREGIKQPTQVKSKPWVVGDKWIEEYKAIDMADQEELISAIDGARPIERWGRRWIVTGWHQRNPTDWHTFHLLADLTDDRPMVR